uniref:Uncharacterized protein n=1 Tax=Anguilla anguilla TaxID=7936 RepID=A0A0E9QTL9_ANGAN
MYEPCAQSVATSKEVKIPTTSLSIFLSRTD